MFEFRFLGVPVTIQPVFWLGMAFIGGALNINSMEGAIGVLIFMIIGLISVLTHEYGHALSARQLASASPTITLTGLGGFATHEGARFTRQSRFFTILAGPMAGFALFGLAFVALFIFFGKDAIQVTMFSLFHIQTSEISTETATFLKSNPYKLDLITDWLWVNFWWSTMNLLPVYPLDGGQIADTLLKSRRTVLTLGITCGVAMAVLGVLIGFYFMAILFGVLAYQNYAMLQSNQMN